MWCLATRQSTADQWDFPRRGAVATNTAPRVWQALCVRSRDVAQGTVIIRNSLVWAALTAKSIIGGPASPRKQAQQVGMPEGCTGWLA
ncbi:hypothetical protein N7490_010912 [Penicillium lividum]|nr:hypothetical protein N7490_010912 [Penicillium lividum]